MHNLELVTEKKRGKEKRKGEKGNWEMLSRNESEEEKSQNKSGFNKGILEASFSLTNKKIV